MSKASKDINNTSQMYQNAKSKWTEYWVISITEPPLLVLKKSAYIFGRRDSNFWLINSCFRNQRWMDLSSLHTYPSLMCKRGWLKRISLLFRSAVNIFQDFLIKLDMKQCTYSLSGNKHFFTESCQNCEQSLQKLATFLENKVFLNQNFCFVLKRFNHFLSLQNYFKNQRWLRRLFIILVSLTMTSFSEKMPIFTIWITTFPTCSKNHGRYLIYRG